MITALTALALGPLLTVASQLDQIYRVLRTLGLGVLLVGASYLYQRYRAQIA